MTRRSCVFVMALLVIGAGHSSISFAAEDQIAQQIEQLDSDDSATRDAAEVVLIEAGPAAVEPLGKAALTGSLERRFRAVRILGRLLRASDEKVGKGARAALESIAAEGEAAVAEEAREALTYLRRLDLMRDLANQFKVLDTADAMQPPVVKLIEQPLLRFQDRMRENADGTLWAYSNGGRPKVVVATFPFPGDVWYSDAVALGDTPIEVKAVDGNDGLNWSPSKASEKFRAFPRAKKPAKSADERLGQLHELANRMAARESTPKGEKPYDLSLFPKPLLRYSDDSASVIDGALFAFVHDTNPEVIVLIEAQGEPDSAVWKYRLARHTSVPLHVEIDDEDIWTSPAPTDYLQGGDRPYWVVRRTVLKPTP